MEPSDRLPSRWPYDVSKQDAARVLGEVENWLRIDPVQVAKHMGMDGDLVRRCLWALRAARLLPKPGQWLGLPPEFPGLPGDLAWGTVLRHIKLLEERGEIEIRRVGREVHLFPAGVPGEQSAHLAALRDDHAHRILDAVRERGEVRIQELADALGLSRKVVRRYLRTLCDAGLLRQTGHYHPRYEPVDKGDGEEDEDAREGEP